MAHDVFISYAAEDKSTADAICAFLENQKIRCWIAPRDILPGQKYSEAIVDAVDKAKVFVLVFSSKSDKSPHIMSEVQRAFNKEVIIIPFRIEDIEPSKRLDYYIGPSHWLDALTPPMENHIKNLEKTIRLLLSDKISDQQSLSSISKGDSYENAQKKVEINPIKKSGNLTESTEYPSKQLIIYFSVSAILVVFLIIGLTIWDSSYQGQENEESSQISSNTLTHTHTYTPTPSPTPTPRLTNPKVVEFGFSNYETVCSSDGCSFDASTSKTSFGLFADCILAWIKLGDMEAGDVVTWKWTNSKRPSTNHQASYTWKSTDGTPKIVYDRNNYCSLAGLSGDWTVIFYVNDIEVARGQFTKV